MLGKIFSTLIIILVIITGLIAFGFDSKISNPFKDKNLYELAEKSFRSLARSSCAKPLAYRIGSIDPAFNISEEKLSLLLKEAENVWENQTGHNLFVYSPDDLDAVTVNMIFDERQEELIFEKTSRADLQKKWGSYETLTITYEKLVSEYENKRDAFDQKVDSYNIALDSYNKKTTEYNKNGGSKSEYNSLLREKEKVDSLFSQLDREQKDIINTSQKLKELGEVLNRLYEDFSQETDKHNKTLDSEVVEVGVYDYYQINIYQYETNNDLRITLAHEMGHSLGLDHVDEKGSIMYYLHPETSSEQLVLSNGDLMELNEVCNF